MNTQLKNSLLLLLCSFIWGTAFVAQSAGAGLGAYSFLAGRSWLAVLVPVSLAVRAAFFVRRLQALTDAAWMLVYYASRAFLPLLLVLLASFTAYILLKKEEI